jgi:hypothetical protein
MTSHQEEHPMESDNPEYDFVVKEIDVFLAKSLLKTLYLLQVIVNYRFNKSTLNSTIDNSD